MSKLSGITDLFSKTPKKTEQERANVKAKLKEETVRGNIDVPVKIKNLTNEKDDINISVMIEDINSIEEEMKSVKNRDRKTFNKGQENQKTNILTVLSVNAKGEKKDLCKSVSVGDQVLLRENKGIPLSISEQKAGQKDIRIPISITDQTAQSKDSGVIVSSCQLKAGQNKICIPISVSDDKIEQTDIDIPVKVSYQRSVQETVRIPVVTNARTVAHRDWSKEKKEFKVRPALPIQSENKKPTQRQFYMLEKTSGDKTEEKNTILIPIKIENGKPGHEEYLIPVTINDSITLDGFLNVPVVINNGRVEKESMKIPVKIQGLSGFEEVINIPINLNNVKSIPVKPNETVSIPVKVKNVGDLYYDTRTPCKGDAVVANTGLHIPLTVQHEKALEGGFHLPVTFDHPAVFTIPVKTNTGNLRDELFIPVRSFDKKVIKEDSSQPINVEKKTPHNEIYIAVRLDTKMENILSSDRKNEWLVENSPVIMKNDSIVTKDINIPIQHGDQRVSHKEICIAVQWNDQSIAHAESVLIEAKKSTIADENLEISMATSNQGLMHQELSIAVKMDSK